MSRKSRFDLSELMAKIETMKQQGKSNRCIGKEIGISEGYIRKLMRTKDLNKVRTNELNKTLTNKTESKPNHSPQTWGQYKSSLKKEKQKKIVIRMMEKGKTEQEIAEHYGWGKDDVHMIILQYQFEQL
jgi:DNA-binding CsgD family transcriptional regulator